MDLVNKVALITGGSRGMGFAIARALAKEGVKIALTGKDPGRLSQAVAELPSGTWSYPADLEKEGEIAGLFDSFFRHFDHLHILVNNAGVGVFSPIGEMTTRDWDKQFNINLRGAFLMTRYALPLLRKAANSWVVFIASLAGKNYFVGGGAYAATKHALRAFAHILMLEERDKGIHVLTLCPGSVDTDFSSRPPDDPKRSRMLKPEDVAKILVETLKLPEHAMVSEVDIRPSQP